MMNQFQKETLTRLQARSGFEHLCMDYKKAASEDADYQGPIAILFLQNRIVHMVRIGQQRVIREVVGTVKLLGRGFVR